MGERMSALIHNSPTLFLCNVSSATGGCVNANWFEKSREESIATME